MLQERKEYRKHLNAFGQLHVGGETLQVHCYDISVKGGMIGIQPGDLLTTVQDFETLLTEDERGEIFVKELNLVGEIRIVWVREEHGRILMGLEFENVVHHASKLWLKRRCYRKTAAFNADLGVGKKHLQVEGINRSVQGVCVRINAHHPEIKVNVPVKLSIKELDLNAVGKVVWVKEVLDEMIAGLQIIPIKP